MTGMSMTWCGLLHVEQAPLQGHRSRAVSNGPTQAVGTVGVETNGTTPTAGGTLPTGSRGEAGGARDSGGRETFCSSQVHLPNLHSPSFLFALSFFLFVFGFPLPSPKLTSMAGKKATLFKTKLDRGKLKVVELSCCTPDVRRRGPCLLLPPLPAERGDGLSRRSQI